MSLQKKKPFRSEKYLKWIRSTPCMVCGTDQGIQPHHLIGHGTKGGSLKSDDRLVMPLCAKHHHELHHNGHATFDKKHSRMGDPAQIYFVNLTIGRARLAKQLDAAQIRQARGVLSNMSEVES